MVGALSTGQQRQPPDAIEHPAPIGTDCSVPYPSRPVREPLPEFRGTATTHQTPAQRQHLLAFVVARYEEGLSLREIAELTGRTQSAIRRALNQAGIPRRGRGAQRLGLGLTARE